MENSFPPFTPKVLIYCWIHRQRAPRNGNRVELSTIPLHHLQGQDMSHTTLKSTRNNFGGRGGTLFFHNKASLSCTTCGRHKLHHINVTLILTTVNNSFLTSCPGTKDLNGGATVFFMYSRLIVKPLSQIRQTHLA